MKKDTQHKKFEKVVMTSENIENDNLQKLRSVFPQFVKDGQIDFDALQAFLKKEGVLSGEEKYGLSWAGKSNAFQAIRMPSTGTLTPQPDESKNWDTTENLFIEGDNLEVLKLLQKNYANPGKIKMIYIDPPYNTGKDFIYKDNFTQNVSDYYEQTGQSKDGIKLTSNPESNGRYHSDWLTMMYPRLFLAHNLLKDDGVIFVSIDDNEVANLRMIMDEIFGEENFEGQIHWRRRSNQPNDKTKMIGLVAEHILVYAKNSEEYKKSGVGKIGLTGSFSNPDNDPRGLWASKPWKTGTNQSGTKYKITIPTGKVLDSEWMGTQETFDVLLSDGRIFFPDNGNGSPRKKYYKSEREEEGQCATNWWTHDQFGNNQEATEELKQLLYPEPIFSNPKPVKLIKSLIQVGNLRDGDIILDFFAGSGTTAEAVYSLNSDDESKIKFVVVQIPEVLNNELTESVDAKKITKNAVAFLTSIGRPMLVSEITKERIRRAGAKIDKGDTGFKAFTLASSNYRRWNTITGEDDEQKLIKQAKLFTEKPLVDGYTENNIVYEILLKEGFDLNSRIKEIKKGGVHCYQIIDGEKEMTITFAKKLTKDQIEGLELPKDTIFVCFDSALDDTTKVNIMRNLMVKVI